jgi:hypothetical protein
MFNAASGGEARRPAGGLPPFQASGTSSSVMTITGAGYEVTEIYSGEQVSQEC